MKEAILTRKNSVWLFLNPLEKLTIMLCQEEFLSAWYQAVKANLLAGWTGTYGQLAAEIGYRHRTRRFGQVMGRLVKSFALRHPEWDHTLVYSNCTGRPAYEG